MKAKLGELISIDLRALAALRIGLALLILIDLALRARDLVAHYTDAGVLTRADLLQLDGRRAFASLHFISGAWQVQALLFSLAAVCAVALLVGYRTRLAAVASWIFLVSLNARNPMVVQGGDVLTRLVLFWSMFLPLGARFSIDSARGRAMTAPARRFLSVATVALLAQIVLMYWVTAWRKSDPEWRTEGTALYYALSLDALATPLGSLLRELPALLKPLTFGVLWLEILGPILLFSPVLTTPIRALTVLAFVLLHVGIGLTMRIGLFPWIAALVMVVFVPSSVWDRSGLAFGFRRGVNAPAPEPCVVRWRRSDLVIAAALLYAITWAVTTLPAAPIKLHPRIESAAFLVRLDQTWAMFAPSPLKVNGWYVVPGRLRDGTVLDLFRNGSAVRWEKPSSVADTFRNWRWRVYMGLLPWHREYAPGYARYLCRTWNQTHEGAQRLEVLDIVWVVERTLPGYRRAEPRQVSLHRHTCA
jgi:hypothetical protein